MTSKRRKAALNQQTERRIERKNCFSRLDAFPCFPVQLRGSCGLLRCCFRLLAADLVHSIRKGYIRCGYQMTMSVNRDLNGALTPSALLGSCSLCILVCNEKVSSRSARTPIFHFKSQLRKTSSEVLGNVRLTFSPRVMSSLPIMFRSEEL